MRDHPRQVARVAIPGGEGAVDGRELVCEVSEVLRVDDEIGHVVTLGEARQRSRWGGLPMARGLPPVPHSDKVESRWLKFEPRRFLASFKETR